MSCRDFFLIPSATGAFVQPELSAATAADADALDTDLGPCSADSLFGGRLICSQPRQGYRFSVDAVLLAHFVKPRQGWRVLDLGCGCGIIGLIIAYRYPDCSLLAVENQHVLVTLACRNVAANGFEARLEVLQADVRQLPTVIPAESFDCVICNPPYFSRGRGRLSLESQTAWARHDVSGSLTDFIRSAAFAVKNRGRVAFIFPASSQARLQQELLTFRLVPKRLQMVYSYPTAKRAGLVLVEAMKNGGDCCEVMPPFYLYDQPGGKYSTALQALYQEELCWPQS